MNDNDLNGSSLPEPCIIVIFGVTGDLARRELMPALYELRCRNLLPEPCAIVGFARRDWSDDKFREEMRAAVSESACKLVHWEEFARRMYYVRGNFDDDAGSSYAALRERIGAISDELAIPEHVLMHLSTPPWLRSPNPARSVRLLNVHCGVWVLLAPWLLEGGTPAWPWIAVASGRVVIALSLRRGPVEDRYGDWQRFIL